AWYNPPALPPAQTCVPTAHSARNVVPLATEIFCQVLPTSNDRCTAPSADRVHCGVGAVPRDALARCGEFVATAFCSPPWVTACFCASTSPLVVSTCRSAVALAPCSAAGAAAPLTSTVSDTVPGSSLTPILESLLSSTA